MKKKDIASHLTNENSEGTVNYAANSYGLLQLVLTVIFAVALLLSNIIASKQILLPFGASTVASVVVFPITYILSDVFSEVYGYKWSRITCYIAFLLNIFMALIFSLVLVLPYPETFTAQEAFETVLGNTPRITAASLLAFVAGDFTNDLLFAGMKKKHPDDFRGFSARAILSSVVGEITDCAVFLPIAFIGNIPAATLFSMGVAQVAVKVLFETVLLPATVFVTVRVKRAEIKRIEAIAPTGEKKSNS